MADYSLDDMVERVESSLSNKSQRSGRGRERGDGNIGGRQDQGREVAISKALSKLLRHDAIKEGLELDREGFAKLDQVLQWRRLQFLKVTFSDIQTAVTDNAKQRFSLKPNPAITPIPSTNDTEPSHWLIRANQGHSIEISSAALLNPITLAANNIPQTVIHGTYYAVYPLILSSGGLKPMSRNHVHFSTGLPEDTHVNIISGMRADAEILIYIDVHKSLEDGGIQWWISENGVVLTEGDEKGLVPTKYWKLVKGRRQDVGVLWEDGVQVAELPQGVKGRKVPSNKFSRGKRERNKGKGVRMDGEKETAKRRNGADAPEGDMLDTGQET